MATIQFSAEELQQTLDHFLEGGPSAVVSGPALTTRPAPVVFAVEDVQPPADVYLDMNDKLLVQLFSSQINVDVVITGVMLRLNSQLMPFEFRLRTTSIGIVQSAFFGLGEGFVITLSVATTTGGVIRGDLFATVGRKRSEVPPIVITNTFISGYVSSSDPLTFPIDVPEPVTSGVPGFINTAVADPAVGADYVIPVNAAQEWEIVAFSAVLLTDANVANRLVQVELQLGTNQVYTGTFDFLHPAATTRRYTAGVGLPLQNAVNFPFSQLALPPVRLNSGNTFATSTSGIQVGDQWAGGVISYNQRILI